MHIMVYIACQYCFKGAHLCIINTQYTTHKCSVSLSRAIAYHN
jgi:hypothetical protein